MAVDQEAAIERAKAIRAAFDVLMADHSSWPEGVLHASVAVAWGIARDVVFYQPFPFSNMTATGVQMAREQ